MTVNRKCYNVAYMGEVMRPSMAVSVPNPWRLSFLLLFPKQCSITTTDIAWTLNRYCSNQFTSSTWEVVHRLDANTPSFYTWDLSTRRFWHLRRPWDQSPKETRGLLSTVQVVVRTQRVKTRKAAAWPALETITTIPIIATIIIIHLQLQKRVPLIRKCYKNAPWDGCSRMEGDHEACE